MQPRKQISGFDMTTSVIQGALMTTATMVSTIAPHHGIQAARAVDAPDLKDSIKQLFAYSAATPEAAFMTLALFDFMVSVVRLGSSMNRADFTKALLLSLLPGIIAGAGMGLYGNYYSHEQNTLAAGASASAAVLAMAMAKNVFMLFAKRSADHAYAAAATESLDDEARESLYSPAP